ncbi:MAG TPA: hypothetical protein VEE82_02780 [Thermodesulfovibrionales bacterium]|nr:hypothetical protein [Thermodesulfovibrionales bacterium]
MTPTSDKRKYFSMAFVVLFSIGLFGSLKTTFGLFGVDSDTSHSAMLWYGIHDHGMNFIKEWIFTSDNWLFSLFPIHFLLFTIFGPKPFVVILTGWLIFIASVLLSGIIAKNLNAPKSARIIPIVLIFSGLYAHERGYLSYATSHNITNLFGLLSFYCLLKWIKVQKNYLLTLIVLLTVAGGLSDPWIIGAYTLPFSVASLFLFYSSRNMTERRAYCFLFSAMIFSLITIKTRIFGTLSFLPSFHFSIGSWNLVTSNAVNLMKDLGRLLNFLPGTHSNTFIPSLFSVVVFLFLMIRITDLIAKRCLPQDHLRIVFYCVIAFSIGGMLLAVLVSDNPVQNYSGRYFINVLYLAVIGVTVVLELNWDTTSKVLKLASILAGVMFISAGIISNYHLWKVPGIIVKDNNVLGFIDFLSKNKLNYGYGPFWGSSANAITWLSESKIRIRPVSFEKITGRMVRGSRAESSKLWYLSDDAVNQKSCFVFVKSDGEECPDINVCINGLVRQFGAPERVLPYDDGFILVWPHPLVKNESMSGF